MLQKAMLSWAQVSCFLHRFEMLGPMGHQPLCSQSSPVTPSVGLAPVTVILAYSGSCGSRMVSLPFSELSVWSGERGMALSSKGCSSPFCGVSQSGPGLQASGCSVELEQSLLADY
ncbi:hypothetical protein XENOCAPTIV_026900 [Xenoophorus captivus]|uniref:Uncharacterized protein n=1 Tax=Xenoophorus captivus TaxID=1517983 RepID=A0ABV0QCC3_9TELE